MFHIRSARRVGVHPSVLRDIFKTLNISYGLWVCSGGQGGALRQTGVRHISRGEDRDRRDQEGGAAESADEYIFQGRRERLV